MWEPNKLGFRRCGRLSAAEKRGFGFEYSALLRGKTEGACFRQRFAAFRNQLSFGSGFVETALLAVAVMRKFAMH